MERPSSPAACAAAIKRINARFRTLKDKDGPLAASLIDRKDELIDAMAAACPHPEIIGTRGSAAWGPMRLRVGPRRICARCGHCEVRQEGGYGALSGASRTVPLGDYLERQGAILKRLGINL